MLDVPHGVLGPSAVNPGLRYPPLFLPGSAICVHLCESVAISFSAFPSVSVIYGFTLFFRRRLLSSYKTDIVCKIAINGEWRCFGQLVLTYLLSVIGSKNIRCFAIKRWIKIEMTYMKNICAFRSQWLVIVVALLIGFGRSAVAAPPWFYSYALSGTNFTFAFYSDPGSTCRVEVKNQMTDPDWVVEGTNTWVFWDHPGGPVFGFFTTPATNTARFYRIYDVTAGIPSDDGVGYANIAINPGSNWVVNPFGTFPSGSNTLASTIPNPPDMTEVFLWENSSWTAYYYDFFSGAWYDEAYMLNASAHPLPPPGTGFILWNWDLPFTLTFCGKISWFPTINAQPQSCTNLAGTTATFSVAAAGTDPLSYQWRRNSTNLSNAGNVSGAFSSALTLAGVSAGDAANYSVVITNSIGSVTSSVAILTVTNLPTPSADVVVLNYGPAGVLAGNIYTNVIMVTNAGPSVATNVVVVDVLAGGGVSNINVGILAAGGVTNISIVSVAPGSGSLTNTASAGSGTYDPNLLNNTSAAVTAVTPLADVAIFMNGPANVFAASNLTYVISVTNFGPSSATSVTVTDTLPAGVSFVSASGNGVVNAGVVSWNFGMLTSGQVSNLTLIVNVPASGKLTNMAWVSSLTSDPNPVNKVSAPVVTAITPVPSCDPGPATGSGINRCYDDGFVYVDSTGNSFGYTSDWGYQNSSQIQNGNIVFHSQTYVDSNTVQVITDTYSLDYMLPPLSPYYGSYYGPGPLLPDAPISRSMATFRPTDFIYFTNNGTITIIGYTGSGGIVAIPEIINGLPVSALGNAAFSNRVSVASLTIPNSVTSIGTNAFARCYGLTNVSLGNSVIGIGKYAFQYCTNLTSITIPNSVTDVGDLSFLFCTRLTNATIGNNVVRIGRGAFQECSFLPFIIIPASVTNIEPLSFRNCNRLCAITVDVLNPAYSSLDGVLFDKSQTTLIQYPGGKIGSYAIPGGVTTIGETAFQVCTNLSEVTIPNSVTNIGSFAFYATALSSVVIPSGVTSIGSMAFRSGNMIAITQASHKQVKAV